MKYRANIGDFERALGLSGDQVRRLKNAIGKAYNQEWNNEGANVDQINAIVAPYIKTPEEAFYVASVIFTDVFGAIQEVQKQKWN